MESQKVIIKSFADQPYLIKSLGHIFHRPSQFRSRSITCYLPLESLWCKNVPMCSQWSFVSLVFHLVSEWQHGNTSACEQHTTAARTPLRSHPPSNVLSLCSSNMTFVLTHSQCCWIEEFNYGSLTVSEPILAASEAGVNTFFTEQSGCTN